VENENGLLGNSIRFEATRETDGEEKFGNRITSKSKLERKRNPNIKKQGNWTRILQDEERVQLQFDVPDTFRWLPDAAASFSVKNCYLELSNLLCSAEYDE
jgi:hypothetical protein